MRVIKRQETIRETKRGWLNGGTRRYHKTAALALQAVRRRDNDAATDDRVVVTVITWEPSTRVGALVVRVLTGGHNE